MTHFLAPLPVRSIVQTNVPEPAPTEMEWAANAPYVEGDLRIRSITHREYLCIKAHTNRMVPPEDDPMHWKDKRATRRFAPFDFYRSTQAKQLSLISYTLALGFVNAVDLYGLEGNQVRLTVRQGLGGPVLAQRTQGLFEESPGLYQYLFSPARPIRTVSFDDLPIHPDAHVTIDVSGANMVALGIAALGQLRTLYDQTKRGGAEAGASAEPKTTSLIRIDDDFGEVEIVRRASSTDLSIEVLLPADDGAYALALVQDVLDVPVSWRAVRGGDRNAGRYRWLSTFGLGNARLKDESSRAKLSLSIRGFI